MKALKDFKCSWIIHSVDLEKGKHSQFVGEITIKASPPICVWLCGCICVWMCGCVCVYLCVAVSICVWLCGCVCVWLRGCVCVWLRGCVCVYLCEAVCIFVLLCGCICVWLCGCVAVSVWGVRAGQLKPPVGRWLRWPQRTGMTSAWFMSDYPR